MVVHGHVQYFQLEVHVVHGVAGMPMPCDAGRSIILIIKSMKLAGSPTRAPAGADRQGGVGFMS